MKTYRLIKATYIRPTDSNGSMVKISESKRFHDDKTLSKKFPYSYAIGDVFEQAKQILESNGFEIVGVIRDLEGYSFVCEICDIEIKKLKDIYICIR